MSEEGKESSLLLDSGPQSHEVGVIKKGDYLIHILIQEGRHLRMKGAETVDAVIEVSSLGKKLFTTVKEDIGSNASVHWGDHIFFEPKGLQERDIQNGRLLIRILDQQMFKNAVIGTYEMDLSFVYFQDKHAVFNQWIGISNRNAKDFNEICGYLKISASVIGQGDEQVPLTDDYGIDRTDKEVMLIPPYISMQYYQMKFRLIKAERLPKMDTFGS